MEPSANRPTPTPNAARARLVEIRRYLMRLHKALIDAERARFEQTHGPQSNGQLLQALIHDPFFAWLRPFSQLITCIDEAASDKENPVTAEAARDFSEQTGALLMSGGGDADGAARFENLRRGDATVGFAHSEMARALTTEPGAP